MKIAYGTYAMPNVPLEDAIPALAKIGYDGVEICVSPKHVGSLPEQIDAGRRARLAALLRQHRLVVPAFMVMGHLLAEDDEAHQRTKAVLAEVLHLARDLGVREPVVLAMGIGGKTLQWETQRHDIVRYLRDYAKWAEQERFILAGEAHVNAAVDRSDRALWVFSQVNSPWVRMHFDIVHMFLSGERIEDAVKALVPITGHTHVTDARRLPEGKFQLVLPGTGDLDTVAYVKAMYAAGWNDFITLEISTMVWAQPAFDWHQAAVACYELLDTALRKAGVPRG